eukprot:14931672-Alexandrium_andersonii.AAC.1
MPRAEVALAVSTLADAWQAYPVSAVACAAGLRTQDAGAATVAELMELLGYRTRLREWFQPVAMRPIRCVDTGTRLRLASIATEAAAACFVWTDGAVSARQVADAARARAG